MELQESDFADYYRVPPATQPDPAVGKILLAEPFMRDYIFRHSVTLLISANKDEVLGIRLDLPTFSDRKLEDLIPEFRFVVDLPLYHGGPVGKDTLFYLHTYDGVKDAASVLPGVWVNGDFEEIKRRVLTDSDSSRHIRFFMGYACWTPVQLKREMEVEGSWIVSAPEKEMILQYNEQLWHRTLERMGGKFAVWSRFAMMPISN